MDKLWPWNILSIDESNILINDDVNIHNCRIWLKEIFHVANPVPIIYPKVIFWCDMMASFIIGPFVFEEQSTAWPDTSTVTAVTIESMPVLNSVFRLEEHSHEQSNIPFKTFEISSFQRSKYAVPLTPLEFYNVPSPEAIEVPIGEKCLNSALVNIKTFRYT